MSCKPGVAGSILGFFQSVGWDFLYARLFICALWSPAGKGLTSWLSFVLSSVSLSLSHWYPGSGVVLDCIVSWSLQPYLLLSRCPVFWDALKPEPLPVEPSGVPGHRTTKSINPPGQYWYSQGTRPQKRIVNSFPCLSDHTLSQGRVFQEALNPERMPVEPGSRVLLGY